MGRRSVYYMAEEEIRSRHPYHVEGKGLVYPKNADEFKVVWIEEDKEWKVVKKETENE